MGAAGGSGPALLSAKSAGAALAADDVPVLDGVAAVLASWRAESGRAVRDDGADERAPRVGDIGSVQQSLRFRRQWHPAAAVVAGACTDAARGIERRLDADLRTLHRRGHRFVDG